MARFLLITDIDTFEFQKVDSSFFSYFLPLAKFKLMVWVNERLCEGPLIKRLTLGSNIFWIRIWIFKFLRFTKTNFLKNLGSHFFSKLTKINFWLFYSILLSYHYCKLVSDASNQGSKDKIVNKNLYSHFNSKSFTLLFQ